MVTVTDTTRTVTIAPVSGAAVTEGSGASFTVTAAPAPAAGTTLTVNLDVADAQHADFVDEKGEGEQTVEISDSARGDLYGRYGGGHHGRAGWRGDGDGSGERGYPGGLCGERYGGYGDGGGEGR